MPDQQNGLRDKPVAQILGEELFQKLLEFNYIRHHEIGSTHIYLLVLSGHLYRYSAEYSLLFVGV